MTGYDDRKLESFLLNELASAEREEIEQRIFADDELFARVEELETDLIDAFVAGTLATDTKQRFDAALESNPARREKLAVARLLREKLGRDRSGKSNVVPFGRRRTWAFRGALAAGLLALLIGAPMLMQRDDEANPQTTPGTASMAETTTEPALDTEPVGHTTATDSAATVETPLVAVKRPPAPTVAVDTAPKPATPARRSVTFILSTLSLRSGSGLSTLEIAGNVDVVKLQLVLESDEYSSYNVDIRNSTGESIWLGTRLPLGAVGGGPAVSFEVPSSAFDDGRHELVLAGVDESHTEEVAYVDFEVARR